MIENSNHDGTMIWKIPQFSKRKADAENGKYTSIFSLPFYSGRFAEGGRLGDALELLNQAVTVAPNYASP